MKLKFRALEVPKESAIYETNHLGWFHIETLVFNYDGKGTVLALKDGELEEMGLEEFRDVLYGGWYDLITSPESQANNHNLKAIHIETGDEGITHQISLTRMQVKMLYNLLVENYHPDMVGYNGIKDKFYSELINK